MAQARLVLTFPLPEPPPDGWLPPEMSSADELILTVGRPDLPLEQVLAQVEMLHQRVSLPMTWARPLQRAEDVAPLLAAGVDRILLPPDLVLDPPLLQEITRLAPPSRFALSVIGRFSGGRWLTFVEGGRSPTPLELVRWAARANSLGVGEIHLTLLGVDGGVVSDPDLLKKLSLEVPTPLLLTTHTLAMEDVLKALAAGISGLVVEVSPTCPGGSPAQLRDLLTLPRRVG